MPHVLNLTHGAHRERVVQRDRLMTGGLHGGAVVIDRVVDTNLRREHHGGGDVLP